MRPRLAALLLGLVFSCNDGSSDGDADADSNADQDGEADVDGECLRGDHSGGQGERCGCHDDCAAGTPYCGHWDDPESPYCLAVQCASPGAPPCAPGSQCMTSDGLLGLSFCIQCLGSGGGIGDPCICPTDCGAVSLDGNAWSLGCVADECRISPCNQHGLCPSGHVCATDMHESWCVACVDPPTPRGFNEYCVCDSDCEEGLPCHGNSCGITGCHPRVPDECPDGEVCRTTLAGWTMCEPESEQCTGAGDRTNGMPCACDADCDESAPTCINAVVGEIDLGGCTVRPCDLVDPECPDGPDGAQYACCLVPAFIGDPTCMSVDAMTAMGLVRFCW